MRIGLSGLLLWVGLVGVSLANPAANSAQGADTKGTASSQSSGTIKDPFNPQAYMLEMAAKMKTSSTCNAVVGQTGIQRSLPTPAQARSSAPKTSQVTWLSPNGPATAPRATAKSMTSGTTWVTSGEPVARQQVTSTSNTGLPLWSPAKDRATAAATPGTSTSQIRWLTPSEPSVRQSAPPQPVPAPMGWHPSGHQVATEPVVPTNQVVQRPASVQPSSNQVAATPVTIEPPMNHAQWLAPARQVAPQPVPVAPVANQATWQPPVRQMISTSIAPKSPVRHARVLAPAPEVTRQPVVAQPATNPTSGPVAGYQVARQPALPKQALSQETWLAPDNGAAQRALDKIRSRNSRIPEIPAATSASVASLGTLPLSTEGPPVLAPKQLGLQSPPPSPQMLLLSGGAVNPQMARMAANPTAYAATDLSQARHFYEPEKQPWSLRADLDKYREHALKEGSRDVGASLGKALERIGLAVEDTTNVITLGYASDRGQPFRANDGKGLFETPDRVPHQVGATVTSFGDGLYSIADLVTFNALPDHEKSVYQDNHPIVRPLIFTGRTIGGVWKTTEEIGNAVTWGYFDNVTGSIGMCIEDLIEILKHAGQAVTNLARLPVQLIAGKNNGADKALDWVLLVPLEFASNVVEMKGIANTDDYETAFADKGVIGSLLEFGGSTFIVYRAVDEMIDELKDDNHRRNQNSESTAEPEPEVPVEIPETPSTGLWTDHLFGSDGPVTGTRID